MSRLQKFFLYWVIAPAVLQYIVFGVLGSTARVSAAQASSLAAQVGVTSSGAAIFKQCQAGAPLSPEDTKRAAGHKDGCFCFTKQAPKDVGYSELFGSPDTLTNTRKAYLAAAKTKDSSEAMQHMEEMMDSFEGYAELAKQQSLPTKKYIACPKYSGQTGVLN